jgi:2-polyprenyl-6-hydroxyphenyl methylase/3-demethylubiquinone-9 3-methyltransferase
VYQKEWESGAVQREKYIRDYGPIHESIIQLVAGGSEVLDIACGPGVLCRKIKQRLPDTKVTGIDFSRYTIERNREKDREQGVSYEVVDIRNSLASLPGHFDVVIMCEILEHLDEPERVVADAMKLLRTGGRFILTCPHKDGIPDPEHVRIWDHDELFHLLAPYSPTVSFTHFSPPWFHVWMMVHLTKTETKEAPEDAQ